MDFAVIIPTRNRPDLLAVALQSVLSQRHLPAEIVVVDDGGEGENAAENADLVAGLGERGILVSLPPVRRGHGPAYARNAGIAASTAAYICFLDDDDVWTDDGYLAHLAQVIQPGPVDIHFANQTAFLSGELVRRPIWIAELRDVVASRTPGPGGAYLVTVEDLLRCTGFCHLNATCVRRDFFDRIGGFDEGLRYESDRDFYLRAIDQAATIAYSRRIVAHHNVPNGDGRENVSTGLPQWDRWLYQLRLLERASLQRSHPALRAYSRRHKAYVLKKMAESLFLAGETNSAFSHALTALAAGFSLRWLAFTSMLGLVRAGAIPAEWAQRSAPDPRYRGVR